MKTNNINNPETLAKFKAFYKEEKSAPEFLHNYAGFNFLNPFIIETFETPTTYKKIFNALNIPESGNGWRIFAFFVIYDFYYKKNIFKVVELTSANSFNIDIKTSRYTKDRRPDYFFRKADAEIERKEKNNKIIILAQKNEYTTTPKGDKYDRPIPSAPMYSRFSFVRKRCGWHSSFILTERNTQKEYLYYINDGFLTLDKSGYNAHQRREDLKRRAETLRAERLKAKADAINTETITAELFALCENVKQRTAEALKQAKTPADFSILADVCNRWRGLFDLFDNLERFTKKATAKTFRSPEDITKDAETIKEKAQKIIDTLSGAEG